MYMFVVSLRAKNPTQIEISSDTLGMIVSNLDLS